MVGEDDLPMCERQDAATVDGREVEGQQGPDRAPRHTLSTIPHQVNVPGDWPNVSFALFAPIGASDSGRQ